ncbi:MAG: hypothetical protein JRN39_07655 [Nitrososphaerota archaeon]|nr:hypothetical protein [Nitrososphaerota archaeon]
MRCNGDELVVVYYDCSRLRDTRNEFLFFIAFLTSGTLGALDGYAYMGSLFGFNPAMVFSLTVRTAWYALPFVMYYLVGRKRLVPRMGVALALTFTGAYAGAAVGWMLVAELLGHFELFVEYVQVALYPSLPISFTLSAFAGLGVGFLGSRQNAATR